MIEAMKAARHGDLVVVGTPEKLLGNLNAGAGSATKS
jgi:hypothetical protein